MQQFLKDEFIQFATQFSAHQCDPNTSISFTAIYFSLLALYGQTHSKNSHIFHPPISTFVSTLPPFLQGPAFVIPELLFFFPPLFCRLGAFKVNGSTLSKCSLACCGCHVTWIDFSRDVHDHILSLWRFHPRTPQSVAHSAL